MFSPPSSSSSLKELRPRQRCSYPVEAGVAVFGEADREGPAVECGLDGRAVSHLAVGPLAGWE